MNETEIMDVIRGPLIAINEKFDLSTKNMNDFMGEALQLCDNVKKKLLEKESLKTISVKKNDMQFPTLLGKGLQMQKQAKFSSVSMSSILTDGELDNNIMEDTIAARTRGARKARESKMTSQVSRNMKSKTGTRGQNNKNANPDSSGSTNKRSAENEMQEKDCFKKTKLGSSKYEDENKVFKKPKTRGRGKAVKNQETESVKSLDNSTLEESQFFNAPVFFTSSPKINRASPRTSAVALSPKLSSERNNHSPLNLKVQRLSKKSIKDDISSPPPVLTSNDFINEDKNMESDKNISTVESNISNIATKLEKTLSRFSNENTKRTGSLVNSPKCITPKASESVVENQDVKKNLENSTRKSNTPQSRNSRSEISRSGKPRLSDSPKSNATVVLEKSKKGSQVPNGKSDEKSEEPVRVTRSQSSRLKVTQGKNSPDPMLSPSGKDLTPVVGANLNSTKTVREASKRTKPVLKSKIFDDKGNVLPSGPENELARKETAEKTYSLRSSPRTHSLNSPAVKEKNEKEKSEEKNPKPERTKRTRAKDAQKKQEVIDLCADTGRVTRTKTKKAKEEQENAGRKSGLTLLARKSLNKAKIMSLKKEKLKAIQALATRLTNQKGQNQIPSLKVYSHSKNNGSLVRQIAPCLKSTENLMNTGKGKYLALYNERNALITPAKRGETGDLSVRSAAKNAKENEIDKELKLKALKEKEEGAWVKREMAIKNRQKELKEKNEMKLQSAMKQRQKLETEKHNNILQSEKEKEAKTKLLLQEIELKRREDVRKKKMEAEKKQAEAEERKRLKEEARKAREKEQEAERQRILMDKEKEMERHQKWAQERLADEQAREKYENKLKEQLMKAKALSNKKPEKTETTVTIWNYKSRNEDDFGLEDELSENDSMDEEPAPSNRPVPKWAKRVFDKKCVTVNFISQEMMGKYMTCHSKTPDIQKMFKMTPRKKIKRTSSAIWNTPSS